MNQFPNPASVGNAAPAALPRDTRIGIVSAQWHREIVIQARDSLVAELLSSGWPATHIDRYEVPGAFEIPLLAARLARSGRYGALVACGFVVDGGIYRHEFVAAAVIDALMRVQLDTGVPVLSAVLTPKQFHEHEEHRRFFSEHMVKKGREVARACLSVVASEHERPIEGALQ